MGDEEVLKSMHVEDHASDDHMDMTELGSTMHKHNFMPYILVHRKALLSRSRYGHEVLLTTQTILWYSRKIVLKSIEELMLCRRVVLIRRVLTVLQRQAFVHYDASQQTRRGLNKIIVV